MGANGAGMFELPAGLTAAYVSTGA